MSTNFHHYSINVARFKCGVDWDGVRRSEHYCRIEIRETFRDQAQAKARFIQDRFGSQFVVTLTGHVEYGQSVDL